MVRFARARPMRVDNEGQAIHDSATLARHELQHFAGTQAGVLTCADEIVDRYNEYSQSPMYQGDPDIDVLIPLLECRSQHAVAKAEGQRAQTGSLTPCSGKRPRSARSTRMRSWLSARSKLGSPWPSREATLRQSRKAKATSA